MSQQMEQTETITGDVWQFSSIFSLPVFTEAPPALKDVCFIDRCLAALGFLCSSVYRKKMKKTNKKTHQNLLLESSDTGATSQQKKTNKIVTYAINKE